MKDIIFDMINDSVEGIDMYYHDGGVWLIFTNEKRWVIDLTKEGKLWYNYIFFKNIFKYISMDVIENQRYITEWVESVIQNGVKSTSSGFTSNTLPVESVIKNGVKSTEENIYIVANAVESVIQNGVKSTSDWDLIEPRFLESVIQNGVKI